MPVITKVTNQPMTGKSTGREQHANSTLGAQRLADVTEVYKKKLPPITPGDFEFRIVLLRGAGTKPLLLDPFVTGLEWSEEGKDDGGGGASGLTGSITLQRPDASDPLSLPIGRAHLVRLDVKNGSVWQDLWTMRVDPPEINLSGEVTAGLADSLDAAARTKAKFVIRDKNGLYAHEAFAKAAKQVKVKLGSLAEGTVKRKSYKADGTLLDFLVECYSKDLDEKGLLIVARYEKGKLSVHPFARNPVVYDLTPQLRDANVTQEARVRPTTVLKGTSRSGKGKKAKKHSFTFARPEIIDRYGYIRSEQDFGRASAEDLAKRVKERYAKGLRVLRSASLTVPGIPYIRFGDAAILDLEGEGFKNAESFVFVKSVSHSLSSGEYAMSLEVTSTDPFKVYQAERDKKLRDSKIRKKT